MKGKVRQFLKFHFPPSLREQLLPQNWFKPESKDPSRYSDNNSKWRNVLGNYTPCTDNRPANNGYAPLDNCIVTNQHIRTDYS